MEYGTSGESVDDAGVLGRRYAGLEKPEYGADCEAIICKNAAVHTVVLMHDAYQTSVDAALETIDTLTAEGYTFVTIEECLID